MSAQIFVQNPENAIVGFTKIIDRLKAGRINYSGFERNIENIALTGASVPQHHLMPLKSSGLCPAFEKQMLLTFTKAK